jgi:hypothetical protein
MTVFLSLDDTSPASGFVHSTAGSTANGGQVAGQDIAGMAPRAVVFTLANHDPEFESSAAARQAEAHVSACLEAGRVPELRGGSWPRPRGRRPAVQRLSPTTRPSSGLPVGGCKGWFDFAHGESPQRDLTLC